MNMESWVLERLDEFEAQPHKMARGLEALEGKYMTLLECFLVSQGKDPTQAHKVYLALTYNHPLPVSLQPGATIENTLDHLKQVRGEILG